MQRSRPIMYAAMRRLQHDTGQQQLGHPVQAAEQGKHMLT